MDLRFVELMPAARVAVQYCLAVQPGEEIAVVTDTRIGEYMGAQAMVEALLAEAAAVGAEAQLITYMPRARSQAELPRITAAALGAADGVFVLPTRSAGHASALREAYGRGARVIALGAGEMYQHTDKAYRLMPRDHDDLQQLGVLTRKISEAFSRGRTLHFTTGRGTDLEARIGDRLTYTIDGIARPGELQMLPPGLAGIGLNPGTAQGTVVVDVSAWPLEEVLTEPIVLTIKAGGVSGVDGGGQAERWLRMLEALNDPACRHVAEIGVGTHPRTRISGEPVEDVRLYGSCHIGMGTDTTFGGTVKAAWHIDANVLSATLEIDGRRILEDGRFLI